MSATSIRVAAELGLADPDGLTALQCRYLEACAAEPHALARIARRLNVAPDLLSHWLEDRRFFRRLRRVVRGAQRRREVTLALVSSRAADLLSEGVEAHAKLEAEQRRTCIELLKLARAAEPKRAPRSKDPEIVLPAEVEMEERARLLERLGGEGGE